MAVQYLFLFCAVLGGTILVVQVLFSFLGFGMDDTGDGSDFGGGGDDLSPSVDDTGGGSSDASGEVIGHEFMFYELIRMLSFRTVVAGFAFFGLGGLAGLAGGLTPFSATIVAAILGFAVICFVYAIYKKVYSIKSDGTVSMESLVGSHGKVYLRIPSKHSGAGKVLINHQGRTMEYEALTPGEMLLSGTEIVITKVLSSTSVEVGHI